MNPLENLERRTKTLGNHYQKYILTIKRFRKSLKRALESSGKLMQVHLGRPSFTPSEEMKVIRDLSGDEKTQVQHLSCYYALQFLHMNFRNLDILALGIASHATPTEVYHHFMMNVGRNFRELTSAYIENLLAVYLPEDKQPKFCMCSVGTRADQDDIDVGIITKDNADVEELNMAFQKVTQHMLVYATPLHLYLSENVGKQLLTTTISEYDHLLGKQLQDVIIISELLNAKRMLGNEELFLEFQEKIIDRYFNNPQNDVRFHEGFLRGILGEARALLISPPQMDALAPKHDAIRLLKSLLYAKKTIHNVEEVNAWDIIRALMKKEPHFKSEYQNLFRATSFLEMFKFLLQLYLVQEETFRPDEIDKYQLSYIAERMGYKPIGLVSAWDQLLIDYYRHVKEIRKLADIIIDDITGHLRSISTFIEILDNAKNEKKKLNLPKQMLWTGRFFVGTKYWEDVLNELADDPAMADSFINGLEALKRNQQDKIIQKFVETARISHITVIRLITIIGKRQNNKIGETIYTRMNMAYLDLISTLPRTNERICRLFSHYPHYIHEYLQFLPENHYEILSGTLEKPVIMDELKDYHMQLLDLFNVHKWSSRYFHRFFYRVIMNHPEYLKSLTNSGQLFKISSGLLAMVDLYPNHHQKKKVLGDYYDLEFLRVGIGTMRGADLEITNRNFTEFCDNYTKKLFDICEKEVENESPDSVPSTDKLALLAAGGHARGQAYDDDYDLIAIVDTDDPDVIRHATRIITRMNREILKRGLLPHYRLGEILSGFVSPISKIIKYLSSDDEESFIDLSQLLGARMIIGSEAMEEVIRKKILDRFVFKEKEFYIRRMIREVRSRQLIAGEYCYDSCNLKEAKGGLRDIEAIALILKAFLETTLPISMDFLEEMKIFVSDISVELDEILSAVYVLRTIRNLYRLTEAAEDNIHPDYLGHLAHIFRENNRPEWGNPGRIYESIRSTLSQSSGACDKIISYVNDQLDKLK